MSTGAGIAIITVVLIFGIFLKIVLDGRERSDAKKHIYHVEDFVPQELSQLGAKCANCGAAVPPSIDGRVIAHCPYCGNPLPDMKPFIEEAARIHQEHHLHQMKMAAMEREMQKNDQELKIANRELRRERLRTFSSVAKIIRYIAMTIVLLPMIILLLIMAFQLK